MRLFGERRCVCPMVGSRLCQGTGSFLLGQALVMLLCVPAFAAHPLITDDTGTQGEGMFQIEANFQYSHHRQGRVTEKSFELETIISCGVMDDVDLVAGVPYQHVSTKERGFRNTEAGISDVALEVKWRFLEHSGWSLALKPGITVPTGDKDKGLGLGRISPSLFFILTKETEPLAFHLNLGYMRNENRLDERTDLWHASIASEVEILKELKAVANIGVERNSSKDSATLPAFILGGFICSLTQNLDLDVGLKAGLTRSEPDYSILAGVAWRF